MLHEEMVRKYHKIGYTNNYVLCFVRNKTVYAAQVDNVDVHFLMKVSKLEKRSGGAVLRYKPNKDMQDYIIMRASVVRVLCSAAYLEAEIAENKKMNRGNVVEKLVTMAWHGCQTPASLAFTQGGDMIANGKHYQVKFGARTGGATFTNEKTLYRQWQLYKEAND